MNQMPEPRIDSIRFSTTKPRKIPKAGDMKTLKGDGKTYIRQQVMISGMMCVSNGKPVWEWVEYRGARDRTYTLRFHEERGEYWTELKGEKVAPVEPHWREAHKTFLLIKKVYDQGLDDGARAERRKA